MIYFLTLIIKYHISCNWDCGYYAFLQQESPSFHYLQLVIIIALGGYYYTTVTITGNTVLLLPIYLCITHHYLYFFKATLIHKLFLTTSKCEEHFIKKGQ